MLRVSVAGPPTQGITPSIYRFMTRGKCDLKESKKNSEEGKREGKIRARFDERRASKRKEEADNNKC